MSSVVKHMENGVLLDDPKDVKDLNEKIMSLIKDKELRDKMGEKELEMAREKFSWEKVGRKFEQLMLDIPR